MGQPVRSRRILKRSLVGCLLLTGGLALAAPSLAERMGRWVCLPDDPAAPQILVDFEEGVYRRCDQNICSQYDILSVRRLPEATEVAFAPGAMLRTGDAGGRYTETRITGGATLTMAGMCSFQDDGAGARR